MSGKHLAGFVLAVVLFHVTGGCAWAVTIDRIIATVDDEIITFSDYQQFVQRSEGAEIGDEIDPSLLKSLVEEKIILHEAQRFGIAASDEEVEMRIQEFLRENGLSLKDLRASLEEEGLSVDDYRKLVKENIISVKLIDNEVDAKIVVSEDDIASYYDQNRKLFLETPEKLVIMAIFLQVSQNPTVTELTDLKIKSLKIYEQIKQGELFEKMVVMHSDEPLKGRRGVLGEFRRGELMPALDEAVAGLEVDEVSAPVWTKEGVHILKVAKRIPAVYKSFDSVRQRIYSEIFETRRERKYNEWMKSLWEKSAVKMK